MILNSALQYPRNITSVFCRDSVKTEYQQDLPSKIVIYHRIFRRVSKATLIFSAYPNNVSCQRIWLIRALHLMFAAVILENIRKI